MHLEGIMVGKVSETQRDTYCMILYVESKMSL